MLIIHMWAPCCAPQYLGAAGGYPGPVGAAGGATPKIHQIHQKLTKAYQDQPGISRTHLGNTRDALGTRRTIFSFIPQESQGPITKGTRPRNTNRTPETQRQHHAHEPLPLVGIVRSKVIF